VTAAPLSEARLVAVRARSASLGPEAVRRQLLARLDVGPAERVLEIGVGNGRALAAVAARATQGFVAGVDPDPTALRQARGRCRRAIRQGRVALLHGTSDDLSIFSSGSFDQAFGVHVSEFWEDPLPHLRELRRVLRAGGRLLLAHAAGVRPLAPGLAAAGFASIHHERAGQLFWTTAR
jgi:ubiquinone/menaquinone biosynthesis C-methylase UbiE